MARVVTDTEWLRSVGGLTVSGHGFPASEDHLALARAVVSSLVSLAKALPGCRHERHHHGAGPHMDCPFADLPAGPRACSLAADLARLGEAGPGPAAAGPETAARFLTTVRDAAPVVYLCRRVQHVGGVCWFQDGGVDHDLCGRLLALSHRL